MDRLKVFLSSTQKDLQAERDSAEASVGRLGHECLRAETLDAPGRSPEDACRQMARSCDIYLGIFGLTYGYSIPRAGISATEMEYLEARDSDPGKIFIYVKEGEVVDPDQQRFLNEVQNFSNGYFQHAKFSTCDELAEQIWRDIGTWTTQGIRELRRLRMELRAVQDKVVHMDKVMEIWKVPQYLR